MTGAVHRERGALERHGPLAPRVRPRTVWAMPTAPKRRSSRSELSPPGPPPPGTGRVMTWNINGLRARAEGTCAAFDRLQPDVVLLQETKITDLPAAVAEQWQALGYSTHHVGGGGYNGVALLSRWPVTDVVASGDFGIDVLDREPRVLAARVEAPFGPMWAANVYVPNGRELGHWHYTFKLEFLAAFAETMRALASGAQLLVGGDWNVAPSDDDVYDPRAFRGCTHVSPAERAALTAVLDRLGVTDIDARIHGPAARRYTWWNYQASCYPRDRGLRIDLLCATEPVAARAAASYVDHIGRRGPRPSDHAAVVADLATGAAPGL